MGAGGKRTPLSDRLPMIFVGLAPLGFFARTARGAGWWAGGCMALALLTLFVGLRLVP